MLVQRQNNLIKQLFLDVTILLHLTFWLLSTLSNGLIVIEPLIV